MTRVQDIPLLKKQIAEIARLCWERGYIGAIDGNISARLDDGSFLITPAGTIKFLIQPESVVHCDANGRPMDGGRASSETAMHVACYHERKDVRAVVHAHPPTAVAFSLAGISLMTAVIPELVVTLGAIPTAPYGTPGTEELPNSLRDLIRCSDAVLMERHGAITLGADLLDAYKKMEQIEHNAKITFMARQLGQVKELAPEEVRRLLATREPLGIKTTNVLCNHCGNPMAKGG
ncbi:MAG: class II aldolase/adducin family protein [Planctomycetes bacterium]|nr:class II aldolase/adducin family protein [Planctomycetota bacterium]MCC7173423.1 class II aldolase/adducin family protein [Planctomycetota bacterium]